MINLSGYQITQQIHTGINTVICRGVRKIDQKPVVVKFLQSKYPTIEEITRLRQEYQITKDIDCEGIVKTYALEKYKNSFVLILEDFGGQSLKQLLNEQKLAVSKFLPIAIDLVDCLGCLHKIPIIHKDIKPSNIIINPQTEQVKITDFSIASRLSCEYATINNFNSLEGTLAYMSPEQTGRMNRSIDYRTDFYSLGVTFYEMLTGKLPFSTTDPMELVHCHLAKQPFPPHQLNPEIPPSISSIVMKLLSKTVEDRYQSAAGLKIDLENCLSQIQTTGKIESFLLGQHDRGGKLLIPQKLYGRETEVETLINAFARISLGNAEMMLVSGYSGIGKTSTINEIHKPIVQARGYFIAGKFDQLTRNIPYAALIQAFQDLISQLCMESSERIAIWKQKLLDVLRDNGQVIVDVIPELELIIGEQPEVRQLGSIETQNRFNRLFQKFVLVFCQPEHPLVLFLDDLQWADLASLKLIQMLMTDSDSQYLLTIGAYRDNEVSPTHPLMETIEKIQATSAVVNKIALGRLESCHVSQLVAETLDCGSHLEKTEFLGQAIQELAALLFNKTQGNPFFLTQLLKTLYAENLLVYNAIAGNWEWDIEEIQAIAIADYNVVELVARNIQKLPAKTQHVLKLAACIGNQFNLEILSIVNQESTSDTAAHLWSALQAGLILPLSKAYKIPLAFDREEIETGDWGLEMNNSRSAIAYKFLHDRVQQAAYSFIAELDKKATHLKIGELLLKNTTPEERKENIFALVNQLNFGTDLITTQIEKDELAYLNLIAGQKAKAATAYEAAVKYLNVGLELLPTDSWQSNYNLTLQIYLETLEAEYLNSNIEQAEMLSEMVFHQAKTLLDKINVYENKILFYISQSQMQLALNTALTVIEMLGISLCEEQLGQLVVDDLINLPEMTDSYKLAGMRILRTAIVPVYVVQPELWLNFIFTMVNFCIENGNSPPAAHVYVLYAMNLCGGVGDIDSGYKFGQLALTLLDKSGARELKSVVLDLFNAHVRIWKEHIRESLEPLQEALHNGIESGELQYAGYSAINYCTHLLFVGEHLEAVEQKSKQYIDLLLKIKQEYSGIYNNIGGQLVLNLQGKAEDKYRLIGEIFNEDEMMPILNEAKNSTALFYTHLAKTILLYLFKDYEQAVETASKGEKYSASAIGLITFTEHNFYSSLALLAQYRTVHSQMQTENETEQNQYLLQVESNQEKMKNWAYHAPCNFQHKYDLVEAEKARALGQVREAISFYEKAIKGATEQGYIQEEALSYELAAEFHLARGEEKMAQFYMTEAYYCYIRWGAKAKVKDLEERYPQFFGGINAQKPVELDVNRTTVSSTGRNGEVLDLATVLKAAQTLSSEVVLSKLLENMLKIAIENAGAEKGFLILFEQDNLVIEAVGEVDKDHINILLSPQLSICETIPTAVINYVQRTKESVVLNDATKEGRFGSDRCIIKNQLKSVVCVPILNQNQLIGLFYLENNLTSGTFTPQRLELLKLISSQAAICLKNAMLYTNLADANEQLEDYNRTLEEKITERTQELQQKNDCLNQTLEDLKETQTQLIQTEKMSSLGQLVAGVAHEINNPINFIYANISYANEYTEDLLNLVNLYQHYYPNAAPEIKSEEEEIDLAFMKKDLPKLLSSMKVGADRIRQIVLSLRNFSRLDESDMKSVNIHEGIDSTLLILQHRLLSVQGQDTRAIRSRATKGIEIIKEYEQLPLVDCYAGQMNQVFMNILSNAIDALDQPLFIADPQKEGNYQLPTISIRTEAIDKNWVRIRIADNGPGITEEIISRLFDPFFTTKPVGKGTGLGLSISYQIVVDKHGGKLKCISAPGEGTEFTIEIPVRQLSSKLVLSKNLTNRLVISNS